MLYQHKGPVFQVGVPPKVWDPKKRHFGQRFRNKKKIQSELSAFNLQFSIFVFFWPLGSGHQKKDAFIHVAFESTPWKINMESENWWVFQNDFPEFSGFQLGDF